MSLRRQLPLCRPDSYDRYQVARVVGVAIQTLYSTVFGRRDMLIRVLAGQLILQSLSEPLLVILFSSTRWSHGRLD